MKKQVHLAVTLTGESAKDFPAGDVLAQGIYDGLPKEWYDQDIDSYAITDIVGTDAEMWDAQEKYLATLRAELEQERKFTAHLDAQVNNLVQEKEEYRLANIVNLGRIENMKKSPDPIARDRIIENLTEKNDNQAAQLDDLTLTNTGLRDELVAVDTELSNVKGKYDDSLLDWKVAIKERDDAINRADRNYAALEQQGTVADDETARADRLATDLKGCQKANRTYMGMNRAQATAIDTVKGAMQTLGYTFAFEESFDDLKAALGGIRQYIDDASSEVGIAEQELSNIETER
ncbi:MAG: hypothetical protein DRR06_09925 [Gammaproteobacteria bacterium]|nr:MAG: hypothetical protein DRR06_09925 [Gammaproteobacteria bacterium]